MTIKVKQISPCTIEIVCNGQRVLNINEISDKEVINLFLEPIGKDAQIMKSEDTDPIHLKTYELLTKRIKGEV